MFDLCLTVGGVVFDCGVYAGGGMGVAPVQWECGLWQLLARFLCDEA